ncbi:MAG TPA: SDR family NAD(P)-dependent oxidoreductase [Chthoniobacterales bacterium]|nr:SDR family NAD(P)-dependent oxidoreductase [Chthoniobacterales bacterium]
MPRSRELLYRRHAGPGSTAGIGLAIATALAAEGAKVVVNGRTEARVAAALVKIRQRVANAELRGVAADLGTATGVDAFLKQVTEAESVAGQIGRLPSRGIGFLTSECA